MRILDTLKIKQTMKRIAQSIFTASMVLVLTMSMWSCKEAPKDQNQETAASEPERYGGLQLYTLRDLMSEDVEGTLAEVAKAGYLNIEAAGYNQGTYYGMEPEAFKALLDKYGLVPVSSHQGSMNYENVLQEIADAKKVGFKYLVIPVPPMGMFTYDRETNSIGMKGGAVALTEAMNNLGKIAKENGVELLYHNHHFEFSTDDDGNHIYNYLVENTNPEYANFEMDLYWVRKAEAQPIDYFEKYPGRFKLWHVKDMDDQGRFAPVGNGHIDFKSMVAKAKESGMEYYFVEQDQTFNETPLEAINISHKALKELGLK
jgi:sugar phosphate isomerase/epimerase